MKQMIHRKTSWLARLHAIQKLGISIFLALIPLFFVPRNISPRLNFMISWDVFSITMILLSWISIFSISSQEIREECNKQDESRSLIFIIIVICTIASLGEVFLLLTRRSDNWVMIIPIAGLLLSGVLIHTIFAFRYAHLYYMNKGEDKSTHAGGLNFPGDKNPDYFDFAYFAFVLGMTFQVSDVQVLSKRIRRLSLIHALLSFLFNTFFVAITINIIAGLRGH